MNEEWTIYDALQEFYEADNFFDKDSQLKLVRNFIILCSRDECKCRPSYHEVARFVIKNTEIEDWIEYFIEALNEIKSDVKTKPEITALLLELLQDKCVECKDLEKQRTKLEDYFLKVIDHIQLEHLRLNSVKDELMKQYILNDQKVNSLKNDIAQADTHISQVQKNMKDVCENMDDVYEEVIHVQEEVRGHKFDLIALTTLIFSAFTMLQVNITAFTAVAKNENAIGNIILLMVMINIIVMMAIMVIYSMVRRIHGDMKNEELYLNIFSAVAVLILCGLFGYYLL